MRALSALRQALGVTVAGDGGFCEHVDKMGTLFLKYTCCHIPPVTARELS